MWSRSGPNAAQVSGYRVYRDGRFYKRVRGLSVRVRASRLHTYRVAASDTSGRPGAKSGVVKVVRRHRPPGRPGRLKRRVTDSEVRLSWSRSSRRSGKIAGYRIYRDGVLVRQVRGRRARDRDLAPATRYRFTVAAIDTQGYMGPAAACLGHAPRDPVPTAGRAHAFLLASTGESFRDLQRHYRQIGTVYPTYFECEKTRRRARRARRSARDAVGAAAAHPRAAAVRLPEAGRAAPDPDRSCRARGDHLAASSALVRQHGYDGINIDFENGARDRPRCAHGLRVRSGRRSSMRSGSDLSVEVSAKFQHTTTGRSGLYDYEALGAAADHVFVMNWGWHWSTSAPGAPDDMEMCRRVADYVASMPNKARFVLATHMYGMDWPDGGGPAHTADGARVCGRAGPDRARTGQRRCSIPCPTRGRSATPTRAASRTRCGTRTPPRSRGV